MRTTAIVALVVLAFASPATALARSVQSEAASVHRAISWQRSRTWHWQDVARVKRSPTIPGAARPHSLGYLRWIEHRWNERRLAAYKLAHRPTYRTLASTGGSVAAIVCRVFGPANCSTALAIGRRESGLSTNPYPPNPTHFGIFQLDASAISAYARGRYSTAYEQVVAAHRMFLARGWEPWTCCEG